MEIINKTNTARARPKRRPPSFWTTIPNIKMWLNMAPEITPTPRTAPTRDVLLIINKIEIISSIIPVPILPKGSTPSSVKI